MYQAHYCFKINGTLENKMNNMIQISAIELYNDVILPIYQGGFFGAINVDGKVCIGDKCCSLCPTTHRSEFPVSYSYRVSESGRQPPASARHGQPIN